MDFIEDLPDNKLMILINFLKFSCKSYV